MPALREVRRPATRHYDIDLAYSPSSSLVKLVPTAPDIGRPSRSRPLVYSTPSFHISSALSCPTHLAPQILTTPSEINAYIRLRNTEAETLNRSVSPTSLYAQIWPKVRSDGHYPREFQLPKTVEQMAEMDYPWVERVLITYGLISPKAARGVREASELKRRESIVMLWEFLGAGQVGRGVWGR